MAEFLDISQGTPSWAIGTVTPRSAVRTFESLYREHVGAAYGPCLRLTGTRELAEDCCFEPKAQRSGYGPGTHLVFREGDGNAHMRLGTQSGSMRLCDHP